MILKQIKVFKKKIKKHFLLLSFLALCLVIIVLKNNIKQSESPTLQRQISNVEEILNPHIVAAGTPLIVPPWIQQQYLQQMVVNQALLGNSNLLDFLIHNYSVAAPSSTDEDKDTYYVPLLRSSYLDVEDSDYEEDDDYSSLTEYFDVTNISLEENTDLNEPVFRTVERADTQKNREHIPEPAIRTEPISTDEVITQEPIEEEPATDTFPEELDVEKDIPTEEIITEELQKPDLEEDTPLEELLEKSSTEDPLSIEEPVLEDTDTSQIESPELEPEPDAQTKPLSPKIQEEKNYESRNCRRTSQEEETTEAVSSCTECHYNETEIITGLREVIDTVETQKRHKAGFRTVLRNFCKTCQPVNIRDFIQYVNARSKEKRIPPEIFFSLMMQESNGKCTASNTSNRDNSFGLLQLNTNSLGSTCLKRCNRRLSQNSSEELKNVCKNGTYRTGRNCKRKHGTTCVNCVNNNQPLVCLNNPYCNFEESLHLIKDKWHIGNGRARRPRELNWLNMNPDERNLWRNTIISYNGAGYMKAAEREMRNSGMRNTNDWEKKRLYFIKQNWLNQNTKKKDRVIHNLAYVERITGREIPCGGEHSIIVEWFKFIKDNPSPDCSQFR